jgi:uncharacterized protein (TIGR02246 family)
MAEVSAQSASDVNDVEAITAEIEAAFAEYADSLNEGDAERWIQLWAEDSVQSSPGAPPNVGRDVIYEGIRSEVEQLDYQDMVIEVEEVLTAGDFAVARGMYSLKVVPMGGGDPIPVDGKYTTTFQRQPDGSWKIFRDIYNSNVPPAAPAEPDVEAITAEIEAAFTEYGASLGEGDAERWIQLWTEDGVQSPPGAPPNVGRDTIFTSISAAMEAFAFENMQIDIEEVLVAGDLAIARGLYTVTYVPHDGSAPIPVDGKYTSTFQRQPDGSWKLYRDIFNSNVPPAAPAEPDMEQVAAEVQAFWDEYAARNLAGDVESWIDLWDEDSVKYIVGAPAIEGRDTIQAFKQAASAKVDVTEMSITNQDVEVAGDWAFVRGVYDAVKTPKDGSDPNVIDGWYASVLKRDPDGSWKLYWDTCASKVPPVTPAEPDMEEVAAEVQAFWDEYSAANMAGDSERWIALWEEDGVKMSPGKTPIEGKENIYAGKQASNEKWITDEQIITNHEVEVAGDWAFVRGVFTATDHPRAGGETEGVSGNYMSILKRQPDGGWKLYRDIWSSNTQ